jgi:hypothetical protein
LATCQGELSAKDDEVATIIGSRVGTRNVLYGLVSEHRSLTRAGDLSKVSCWSVTQRLRRSWSFLLCYAATRTRSSELRIRLMNIGSKTAQLVHAIIRLDAVLLYGVLKWTKVGKWLRNVAYASV